MRVPAAGSSARGDRRERGVPRQHRRRVRVRGPFGSYEPFSDVSTGVLTVLMWLGRVEIIPVAVLLGRNYWRA